GRISGDLLFPPAIPSLKTATGRLRTMYPAHPHPAPSSLHPPAVPFPRGSLPTPCGTRRESDVPTTAVLRCTSRGYLPSTCGKWHLNALVQILLDLLNPGCRDSFWPGCPCSQTIVLRGMVRRPRHFSQSVQRNGCAAQFQSSAPHLQGL